MLVIHIETGEQKMTIRYQSMSCAFMTADDAICDYCLAFHRLRELDLSATEALTQLNVN